MNAANTSTGYRFARWLVRLWLGLLFPRIRLLAAEDLPDSGPVVLAVNHPAGLLDALILIAAFEREVGCLVEERLLRNLLVPLAGRLGMIAYRAGDPESEQAALEAAADRLAAGRVVAAFAEPAAPSGPKSAEPLASNAPAARLALEAESRQAGEFGVEVFPVHLLLPVAPSQATELLLYVDQPLEASDYLRPGDERGPRSARSLSDALDRVCRENAFRLHPQEFARLLHDLEELLRADLESDWASRPGWKQSGRDFRLSRFVEDSAERLNILNPGRLVALRESLDRYQEASRRRSLSRLEVELSGAWVRSPARWIAGWAESVLGFPLALWGLANLLGAGAVLAAAGLLKSKPGRTAASLWTARGVVTLICYAAQIALAAHFFSRAVAGTYAASLPLSGLYLWRYVWLLRHRTRMLYLAASLPGSSRKLERMRTQLLEVLDEVRDSYSQAPAVGRAQV